MSNKYTDNAKLAENSIAVYDDGWLPKNDADVIALAQVRATLGLVDQLRVNNLIAISQWTKGNSAEEATGALIQRGEYQLPLLRPEIASILGISRKDSEDTPEEPYSWRSAKEGELWKVELDGHPGGVAFVRYGDPDQELLFYFTDDEIFIDSDHIIAANRLYPPMES